MTGKKLAIGAIAGAAIGLVAGILTAPKSGKETRDKLKSKADDTFDKLSEKKDGFLFKAEEIADDVRTKADEVITNVRNSGKK